MDSSSFGKAADGAVTLIFWLLVLCAIFVPLGVWKLINLIVMLFKHIDIIYH
jgi:hypothetical protein